MLLQRAIRSPDLHAELLKVYQAVHSVSCMLGLMAAGDALAQCC